MTEAAEGVLLIHAFPIDARMWESQTASLRGAGWVVAAPSLPGFGGTPDVGPTMTMGAAADRCLQAADEAGLERFVVCGLSMGGYVAFEIWRMARQRLAGMVLANTRSGQDAPEAAAGRRALADRLDAEGNGFLVAEPPPLLSAGAPEALRTRVGEAIADQPAASIAAAARGMAERVDSTPDLGSIEVPILVITSTGDTLIPPDVSASMSEHSRRARVVEIADAGHLSNLEAPKAFDDALGTFLAGFERV
jgi:3-oxoadipate enol-lactonase